MKDYPFSLKLKNKFDPIITAGVLVQPKNFPYSFPGAKAYFLASNPAYQWISKNYYYIRKTPTLGKKIAGAAFFK